MTERLAARRGATAAPAAARPGHSGAPGGTAGSRPSALTSALKSALVHLCMVLAMLLAGAGASVAQSTVRFAVIGDYGYDSPAAADVARLVKGWQPQFIVTVGDNNYENGEASTIDLNIGRHYWEYICPYRGSHGVQPPDCVNRFFPTLGNHDWRVPGAQPYLDYFTLPGNERYYDVRKGPVHLFIVDSDPNEPDGVLPGTPQAEWLRLALAASDAPWKLVLLHHAPHVSGTAAVWMRWPFRLWGASAVLTGHLHNYERLRVDGLTYVVNGAGGAPLYRASAPTAGSLVRFDRDHGAIRVEADANRMTLEFVTRSGAVMDVVTLFADAARLPGVRIEVPTVVGGAPVAAAVVLDAPAPPGGTGVALSTASGLLSVPASVVVPAGSSTAGFTVQTAPTAVPVAPTFSAQIGAVVREASVTLLPPSLGALGIAPSRTVGGVAAWATVNLASPAPAGGTVVSLASNHPAARVPPSALVPAGMTSAGVAVTTDPVLADTAVTVTASLGYLSRNASLTLAPLLKSLALSPSTATGGTPVKGTLTLNGAAPAGGALVNLSSTDPRVTVPASVTVPAGATTATFALATIPVASRTSATITAAHAGVARAMTLTLVPPVVSRLSVGPAAVNGGTPATATVTLSGSAPAGGATVTLTSSHPAAVSLPASVDVAAGATSVTVPLATFAVSADTSVTLTASANGGAKTVALAVRVPVVHSLAASAATVTGGSTARLTVTLNLAAPPAGVSVALSSSAPQVLTMPTTVLVTGGARSASVTATTTAVAADVPLVVTAGVNGSPRQTGITVKAPVVSALSLSPSSLTGGTTGKSTVTLNGVAPVGGVAVQLSTDMPSVAAVPPSVVVVAGSRTATFSIGTQAVPADTLVTIGAAANGASRTAQLTVKKL